MSIATTVIFARADLSIPGAPEISGAGTNPLTTEARFFDLLRETKPDVVILDLRASSSGVDAILKIRQQSSTPILVVCDPTDGLAREYHIAGAAECLPAPIDILQLNEALQKIERIIGRAKPDTMRSAHTLAFAGMIFSPHQDRLTDGRGAAVKLTSLESRLLWHFASQPWIPHLRSDMAEVLYGRHRPASNRAIDALVIRLRKKMGSLCGAAGQKLIKTEFGRGYVFTADISMVTPSRRPAVESHLMMGAT